MKVNFQNRVHRWMAHTFSTKVINDTQERNHRFLEEALELVQSLNCTREDAHTLVDYVFERPLGDSEQEVGGVCVTLAALCNASNLTLVDCADRELMRVWNNVAQIRAKQATKPHGSPLPGKLPPKNAPDQVVLRGKTWTVTNVSWGRAEPDVGILSDYVDEFDLQDADGNLWDWNTEQLTRDEDAAVNAVLRRVDPDDSDPV